MLSGGAGSDNALITGRLNVNDLVAARTDDIHKLERLIASSATGKKRAFQSLPRTERRRAASHDASRVPRKRGLRKRAVFENDRSNAQKPRVKKRPKRVIPPAEVKDHVAYGEKAIRVLDGLRYANRQRDKIWLPTHVWHKKRAFLEYLGGFMVPKTAKQKQYRRTSRLFHHIDQRGAMAWDTSYNATLLASTSGPQNDLGDILDKVFSGVSHKIYRKGEKIWQGCFSNGGPLLVHWYAENAVAIQCHPLIFDELWNVLMAHRHDLNLQDARFAIGSIDLCGPQALDVLTSTFSPLSSRSKPELIASWMKLGKLMPHILPYRAVYEYEFADPRIPRKYCSFLVQRPDVSNLVAALRSSSGGGSLYSQDLREKSLKGKQTQGEIDFMLKKDMSGRETAKITGFPVTIAHLDDGRIRVLMPRDWVLPSWLQMFKRKSLMIGGQDELHQLFSESSRPFFPTDFPSFTAEGGSRKPSLEGAKSRTFSRSVTEHSQNRLIEGRMQELAASSKLKPLHVNLVSLKKGIPHPGASIYLTEAEKTDGASVSVQEDGSGATKLVGFVTSGSFDLTKARGSGLGLVFLPLEGLPPVLACQNEGSPAHFLAQVRPILKE